MVPSRLRQGDLEGQQLAAATQGHGDGGWGDLPCVSATRPGNRWPNASCPASPWPAIRQLWRGRPRALGCHKQHPLPLPQLRRFRVVRTRWDASNTRLMTGITKQ